MTPEERARAFFKTRKTLILATVGADGTPTASYAPFVKHGDNLYIYISELSKHTRDLVETKRASVLLIEDEKGARNLFARKRITFSCEVAWVPRTTSFFGEIMDLFGKTFGKIFNQIEPLQDFILFSLSPVEALYVEGFGKAYRLKRDLTNPIHIRGNGHKT